VKFNTNSCNNPFDCILSCVSLTRARDDRRISYAFSVQAFHCHRINCNACIALHCPLIYTQLAYTHLYRHVFQAHVYVEATRAVEF
jgi:hypothetical protein